MTDGTTAAGYTNPDLLEVGPLPRSTGFARWGRWAEPDPLAVESLGPPLTYRCMRSSSPLTLDPTLSHHDWGAAAWSAPFTRIEDGGPVALSTQVALLWDDHALYAGFRLEDPDVRAVRTGFNDHVYVEDEDIELFIDLGPIYYELGLNAINQGYQIRWVWLDEVVARGAFDVFDELFRAANNLYFVPRPHATLGRHGDLDFQLPGLQSAVHVDGAVNAPGVRDVGWSAMIVLPWTALDGMALPGGGPSLPPLAGDVLRMTSYRAHHDREVSGANPPAIGWAWSPIGNGNVHVPERWVSVTFSDDVVG